MSWRLHLQSLACAAAALVAPAVAAQTDPLQAPACQQALAALQAHETAAAATRQRTQPASHAAAAGSGAVASDPAWQALRRQAARACLGERDEAPRQPQHQLQPPIAVPPVTLQRAVPLPPGSRAQPPGALQSLPAPPPRPLAVTTCDVGGCWANDGSRLNRIGPDLLGPRGVCTVHAGLLNCP